MIMIRFKRIQLSKSSFSIRHYRILSSCINSFDPILRTKTSSTSVTDKLKVTALNPALQDVLIKRKRSSSLAEKVKFLKKKLGKEFELSDELLVKSLFPFNQDHIEIQSENGDRQLVDISAILKLGQTQFELQRNLFLMNRFERSYEQPLDIFDERIAKLMNRKGSINNYLSSENITAHALKSDFLQNDQVKNSLKTILTVIGLISYQHNSEKATKFIKKKILEGRDGLLYHVLDKLNN